MSNKRPSNLSEFFGKDQIKKNILIFIESAKKQNKPLDHCLLYGLPGTGKTSLASVIANEMQKKIKIVQGNTIQKPSDIINVVLSISAGDILFIDEIHAINPCCVEILYSIMEDFFIDINIGKDFNSKISRIAIPRFTLIGATTSVGKISQPLEDRFGIMINLGTYSVNEIVKIVKRLNRQRGNVLTVDEMCFLSQNAKGIPRIAIRLYERVCDFKNKDPNFPIAKIFNLLSIYENGIDSSDLNYLRVLKASKKPLGLKTISQITGYDQQTIESKIEPYLLANGYITKTGNGREISNLPLNFLKKHLT